MIAGFASAGAAQQRSTGDGLERFGANWSSTSSILNILMYCFRPTRCAASVRMRKIVGFSLAQWRHGRDDWAAARRIFRMSSNFIRPFR